MKKKLKDICTQVRGVSYKPSDLRDENSGVPILRANNIQDTGIVLDELVYVDSSKVHSEQYLLTDDIVICASSGSKNLVGKAATFKSDLSAKLFVSITLMIYAKLIFSSIFSQKSTEMQFQKVQLEQISTI